MSQDWTPQVAIPAPPPAPEPEPEAAPRRRGMIALAVALVLVVVAGLVAFAITRSDSAEAQPLALSFTQGEERTYDVSNRSTTDRTLLIEHPNRKGQGFQFVGDHKPKEEAADVYRFEVPVGAKKDLTYTVIEEREGTTGVQLTNNADDQIRYFISLKEAPQGLKAKLQEALKVKASWDKARQDIQGVNARVQAITADQKRLRENLRETPKESPLFQRYLKTLEEQEKEMDDLSARLKALQGDEAKAKSAYDTFLANLSAE